MMSKIEVPRELLERVLSKLEQAEYSWSSGDPEEDLRALLAAPEAPRREPVAPHVVGYMPDSPDGDPLITLKSHQDYVAELRAKIEALCNHPSMSFHQVALLEGVLSSGDEACKTEAPLSPDHLGGGAGMVLPERMPVPNREDYDNDIDGTDEFFEAHVKATAYNSALAKVKELNQ